MGLFTKKHNKKSLLAVAVTAFLSVASVTSAVTPVQALGTNDSILDPSGWVGSSEGSTSIYNISSGYGISLSLNNDGSFALNAPNLVAGFRYFYGDNQTGNEYSNMMKKDQKIFSSKNEAKKIVEAGNAAQWASYGIAVGDKELSSNGVVSDLQAAYMYLVIIEDIDYDQAVTYTRKDSNGNTKASGTYKKNSGLTYGIGDFKVPYGVVFNTNGHGTAPSAVEYTNCGSASLTTLSNDGAYLFDGWYTDATGGSQVTSLSGYANNSTVGNTTLYAHWREHVHNWAYVSEGNTIYAYCTKTGEGCDHEGNGKTASSPSVSLNASDKNYDGSAVNAYVSDNNWTAMGLSLPSVTYSPASSANVGTYTASISAGNVTASQSFTISKANQNATVSVNSYAYGSSVSTPSITGVQENAVPTYYYNTSDAATGGKPWSELSGTTLDPDTYYVYATLPETTNYNSSTTAVSSFRVIGNEFTDVTASGYTGNYDGKSHGITVSTGVSGAVVKYGLAQGECNSTVSPVKTDAGTYTIYYEVNAKGYNKKEGSVTVQINPVAVTVTPDAGQSKVYGSADPTYSFEVEGLVNDETKDVLGLTLTRAAGDNVGEYAYQIGSVTNTNYTVTLGDSDQFVITQAAGTVSEISDISKTYDGSAVSAPTFVKNNESGAVTVSYKKANEDDEAYTTTAPSEAGEYVVRISVGSTWNYKEVVTSKNFTIAKADAVVGTAPSAAALTYNGEAQALVSNGSSADGTVKYSLDQKSWSTEVPTAVNASTYTVYYQVSGDANHNDSEVDSVTVTIDPKQASVVWEDAAFTYNGKTQAPSATLAGVLEGDGVSVDVSGAEVNAKDGYTAKAVLEGSDVSNYVFSDITKEFSISRKDISGAVVVLGDRLTANETEQTQGIVSVFVDGLEVTYEVSGNTALDAGVYEMTITGTENFTGSVSKKYVVVDTEKADTVLAENEGNVSVVIEKKENTPETVIGNSKAELMNLVMDANDYAEVASGAKIDIILTVQDASDSISEESKKLIVKEAGDYKVGSYIDISLLKRVTTDSSSVETAVHETSEKIKITVTVPTELLNSDSSYERSYVVIRNHAGTAEVLKTVFENGTLTFETDRFSDYAIAYKDVKKPVNSTPGVTEWNKAFNKGEEWITSDGQKMTSLGDGTYYNQYNKVFDGEGNVIGTYNPNTGYVTRPVPVSTTKRGYIIPNTSDSTNLLVSVIIFSISMLVIVVCVWIKFVGTDN